MHHPPHTSHKRGARGTWLEEDIKVAKTVCVVHRDYKHTIDRQMGGRDAYGGGFWHLAPVYLACLSQRGLAGSVYCCCSYTPKFFLPAG